MSTLSRLLIALKQGAFNTKKTTQVFAFYYAKLKGIEPYFPEPIPIIMDIESGGHESGCECELCKGCMYSHNNVDLYNHFRKCFIEVIMQDENRYRMSSDELANLVLEYMQNNN